MDRISETIVTIVGLIVAVAILSVLVSPKATTSQVIQATASGFGNDLAVAMTPVTGQNAPITLAYPSSGNGTGLPTFGAGGMPGFY